MKPKVIDLFSGCGGLALGFDKAGFDIVGGVELMPEAHQTITNNLCWRYGKEEQTHICGDITQMESDLFQNRFGEEGCIVIGGPPCQAYSLAGRAKLRSLGESRINTNDKRGYLYQEFLRFALGLNARAVIMENVPESINYGEKNIPQIVCETLQENGYTACWTILNAADYGVPQVRERVFVLAIKQSEAGRIFLPSPTHRNPTNGLTNYQKQFAGMQRFSNFATPNEAADHLPQWVSVGDALSDLPVLFPNENTKYKLIPLNVGMKYKTSAENAYQKLMRNWFSEESQYVTGNAFRKTVRDFPIFARMKQGDNFVRASEIADNLLKEENSVFGYTEGSPEYENLKKKIVPPYARDKFPDKWKRLSEDRPSHTLVAHLSVDTYSHIHPWEPRGISVREAARIQSFPDDFYFECAMGDAYKQIGNAVPPLLSYAIAKQVYAAFTEE